MKVKLFYTGSTFGMDGLHKFKSCESGLHPLSPFKIEEQNAVQQEKVKQKERNSYIN